MSAIRPVQTPTDRAAPLVPVAAVRPGIRRRSELFPDLAAQAELDKASGARRRGARQVLRSLEGALPSLPAFEIMMAGGLVVLSAAGAVY